MVTDSQALINPVEHLGRDFALNDNDDLAISNKDDFKIIKWYDNLKQAMINRLRTAKGESTLHPDYGSRLHEILGSNPNDETLLLTKAYVKEALLQEPRILEILSIDVKYSEEAGSLRNQIDVSISVQPIMDLEVLNMVFRLFVTGTIVGGPN